jgi:hypothetical protein
MDSAFSPSPIAGRRRFLRQEFRLERGSFGSSTAETLCCEAWRRSTGEMFRNDPIGKA